MIDRQEATHRVVLKRILQLADLPFGDNAKTPDLEKLIRHAKPEAVANVVSNFFDRAAKAWEMGDASGEAASMEAANREAERLQTGAEKVLALFGIKTDYPGLYPRFIKDGQHYNYDDLRRII